MQIVNTITLTNMLSITQQYVSLKLKQARDNKLDYITLKGTTFYFRKRIFGKGYEFCELPFDELLNSIKGSLNSNSNNAVVLENKNTTRATTPPTPSNKGLVTVVRDVKIEDIELQKTILNLDDQSQIKLQLKKSLINEWDNNKQLSSKEKLTYDEFIERFKITHKDKIDFIGKFSCSRKNYRDYKKAYEKDGFKGLIDKRGRQKGSNYKIENWVIEMVSELFKDKKGTFTAKNIYQIVNTEAYSRGLLNDSEYKSVIRDSSGGVISLSRIRDVINEIKKTKEFQYLVNPDKFKNSHLPAFGDMREIAQYANHYWEIDSTQLDSFAKLDIDIKESTWSLISISDVKTAMKVIGLVKNSNSQGIAELLYKAFMKLGIPENIITDNGKDYLSKHILGLFDRWGIGHVKTAPFSGEEKPFVERHFGTLQNQFTHLLKGFKGHSVTQFQAINAQTKTADRISGNKPKKDIETVENIAIKLDEWIDYVYAQTKNSSLGISPYESYIQDADKIKRTDELTLTFAFGKQIEVTIGKKGIRYNKKLYNNLDGLLGARVGDDVFMILDLMDHNKAYLFDEDSTFICPLSTDKMTQEGAINARNYYREDKKEIEKRARTLQDKYKNIDHIDSIIGATKTAFKDQTSIELIGGKGSLQNDGNIANLEDIAKEIAQYEDKIKTISEKPNLEIHKKALLYKKENPKTTKGTISYEELIRRENQRAIS